jgi:acetate kinase
MSLPDWPLRMAVRGVAAALGASTRRLAGWRTRCNKQHLDSGADSRIGLYVIPTDEELMIARHTLRLLQSANPRSQEQVATARLTR